MKLFDNLDRYLIDKNYKIIIKENIINIINYKEIKDFSSTKIEITSSLGKTIITGENLVVSKMQDNEVLITGKIKMIQF